MVLLLVQQVQYSIWTRRDEREETMMQLACHLTGSRHSAHGVLVCDGYETTCDVTHHDHHTACQTLFPNRMPKNPPTAQPNLNVVLEIINLRVFVEAFMPEWSKGLHLRCTIRSYARVRTPQNAFCSTIGLITFFYTDNCI